MATSDPPNHLLIHQARLTPGSHAVCDEIEREIARDCAAFGLAHPYIGMEALSPPEGIWFVTGWTSEADLKKAGDDYAKNAPLSAAMQRHQERKAPLIAGTVETFTRYRQDLSRGMPWRPGLGRFLVVAVTKGDPGFDGTVFEDPDGTRFVFAAADTREEADATGAESGLRVFAVRADWSVPAEEWVAADPEFWSRRFNG
jgi:hypothetical protein